MPEASIYDLTHPGWRDEEIARMRAEIERLRAALRIVRDYIKDCDHEPALDEIDAALRLYKS